MTPVTGVASFDSFNESGEYFSPREAVLGKVKGRGGGGAYESTERGLKIEWVKRRGGGG